MSAEPTGFRGWTWQRKGCRVNDADGRKVAEVNVSYCDEAELNRRGLVLASSEDLLAALQECLGALECPRCLDTGTVTLCNDELDECPGCHGEVPHVNKVTRAAIARAVEVRS